MKLEEKRVRKEGKNRERVIVGEGERIVREMSVREERVNWRRERQLPGSCSHAEAVA